AKPMLAAMTTAPELFSITDVRAFLQATTQTCRERNQRWSYGMWARQLGLKSTSSITKIVNGQRDPGRTIVDKLVRHFRFSKRHESYFRDLVHLHKLRHNPRVAVALMERMAKQHPDGNVRLLDDKTFSLISTWYSLAVREMIRMRAFKGNARKIAEALHFDVTWREVKRMIDLLLELGLLIRDTQGALQVSEGRITTTSDITSEAIKRYHEQMLSHAAHALRAFAVEEREFTGSTLIISAKNLPQAKELIRDFRARFAALLEETSGDQVYQIQIQFFPLSKIQPP
ncbi:MAG: DUF4423 domain-containing protein, partial [Bdellovibrionales bacterium]